jgi:hypothetical protein
MEHTSAAAQENFACARAGMGEGWAFDEPRRAAQERAKVFRMDFPHSMRPSNDDAEFPGPRSATRGVGRNKRRPNVYLNYSINPEIPVPGGPGRGALGAAVSAATYNFDTDSHRSERG